jgi:outer membrane receptor protein involved in Fe transport
MRSWTDGGRTGIVDTVEGRSTLRPSRFWVGVFALAVVAVAAGGCGGARAGTEHASAPSGGKLVTAEQIAASGAKTAWDAVRVLVPNLQLRERGDTPTKIQRRGRASIYLDDQVRLMVDNVRVNDIAVLAQIPAGDVLSIELLSGLDATTFYGGSSTSGVIIVRTKSTSQ